ncbi:nucleoporin GLE1-like [Melanaphis sacchari]|uniref:mRNA export factor GLE1 n=2 Tax=Melanaphis sacchari TaxID=742174 RepID=A0A2H8U1A3_9HEMI|nr:nucleoporin GLE1-like [Melanaphis sacchari]
MEFNTTFSNMHQENFSFQNQVSGNNISLFDKNLKRVNEDLIKVDKYYSSKNNHPIENHSQVIKSEQINNSLYETMDDSLKFYDELYKIQMNEIEMNRKKNVRNVLNKKVDTWKQTKKKCSKLLTINIDEDSKRSFREGLIIDKNYNNKLLDSNNDQFQTRLLEEQNKFNTIKFARVLNSASSLLCDIKKLLDESCITSQLLNSHRDNYKLFEISLNDLKTKSSNINEQDILTINELQQNIKILYERLLEIQVKHIKSKTDCHENEENNVSTENIPKSNENCFNNQILEKNKCEKTINEIQNFSFKKNENLVDKSDEFFTFKFNGNKKVNDSNISDFSFKINEDSKSETIVKNSSYNFEDEYKQFLENHLTIQKYLKKIENSYSSFLCDDNLKPLRQELTKSINTPVNSISSVSSWHMKDKFDKLDALLKCKTVKTGNSTVTANSHPEALIFCKDTLAKKIINIGEQVVSVKTETGFEVASIVTELWKIHPDFGILLYARFKQKCPCLIPYNAAKTNEETDEEFYKSLCYNYINGVVEKQDKYVKRMTGIIRLFAAIIVTESKSGKALGIGQAWMLIAATVNLVPQLDVTAIFLHEILVITGYELKQAYGRQFIKMLEYINTNYMKKIDEVTPIGCGGPVQRLKTFIDKIIQVGYIEKPKGIIPYDFW